MEEKTPQNNLRINSNISSEVLANSGRSLLRGQNSPAVTPVVDLSGMSENLGPDNHLPPEYRSGTRLSKSAIVVMAAAITLLFGSVIYWALGRNGKNVSTTLPISTANQFGNVSVPLAGLSGLPGLAIGTRQELVVNGQLQLNGTIVVSPSQTPSSATPGQLYYDQTSNQLNYYNGQSFVPLAAQQNAGIQSITGGGTVSVSQNGQPVKITGASQLNGVTTLDNLAGPVQLQGTLNRILVTSTGSTITIATPQDINTTSSPTFTNLLLTGNLNLSSASVISANNLTQIAPGQNVSIDAGNDELTFSANGRTFQFPSTGVGAQTICTTGISCVAGGQAVLLAPGSAQNNNSASVSLFVNNTGGANLAEFQKNGSDVFTIDNNGGAVANSLVLASALGVTSGGTGATSLSANGVIVGGGASALTSVTAGASGQCLISTAGAPAFSVCPGSGGVVNIDSLTGVLNIADTSGVGSTITIQDASTAQKGIAQFNATNFTSAGGVINTVQGISSAATPTFAGLTLSSALSVASGGTGQTSYSDGQLLIGNSGTGGLNKSTLTAGSGVNITNGNGSITISAPASGSCSTCANTSLSNLTSVAINTALFSGASPSDLGSTANPFRDLYLGGTATNNFHITG
ncbi:MAG: beta strand repeat-containing protein, partial [Candidatus Saccharimonadia bacterium]